MKVKFELDVNTHDYVQNFILRDEKATKIPGSAKYNQSTITEKINWGSRYYGIKGDGSFTKKTFCHANGNIYLGDDTAGSLTNVHTGINIYGNPESVTMQVFGVSRMYFFNGYDTPLYYEGSDDGLWTVSSITYKFVQGVVKDDRLWGFERNTSTLYGSRNLYPDDFTSTYLVQIVIGNEKDSYIQRIELIGSRLYIFKNDSVWVLTGNTKSTYAVERVLPFTGQIAQKAGCFVNSAYVFVSQQDKQVYEFNGTNQPKQLSGQLTNFDCAKELDLTATDRIVCGWDRVNNLFRMSYKNIAVDETYNNYEAIFPTDSLGEDSYPKWVQSYGARVTSYSMWDRQGDHTLVTGSDNGFLYYHNRGSNWGDEAMECILRTDDLRPKEGENCLFDSIYISGVPSVGTITFRCYLNSRLTIDGTKSSQSVSDLGEQGTLESISFSLQSYFNNWIPLLTGYNIGETLAVEFYDNTSGKEISLRDIILDIVPLVDTKNSLVGG